MSSRGLGRYLAPLALLACAAAVLLTVRATLQEETPTTTTRPAAEQSEERREGESGTTRRTRGRRTYTVQPGDTLSQIAEETGVSVEQILELNEDVDPQSLTAGDRLRLRR